MRYPPLGKKPRAAGGDLGRKDSNLTQNNTEPRPGLSRSGKLSDSEKPGPPKEGCVLTHLRKVLLVLLETETLLTYLKK